ncbi:alginate lyase family protein, partial [Beggiatoa alba]|nr:alginate lyase family protein [Beggiatoa alba]
MRYHSRQNFKRGCRLAAERIAYYVQPNFIRRWLFFRNRVNWRKVSETGTNKNIFYNYSRVGKFKYIHYLINENDLDWYQLEDRFDSRQNILIEANEIINHNINVFGVGKISYTNKIDWHRDPISGQHFPSNLFSSRPDKSIDGRFLSELNLHRHFPVLAIAWLVSGEERYAKELIRQILDWIRKNPPVSDAFICDGLELTARVVCWTHCLFLLRTYAIAVHDYVEIIERIDIYGALIEGQYNVSGSHNNHQIAEAVGLFYIGVMYPELKSADRWEKKGLSLLTDNLKYQFLDGGIHSEQSVSYHMFVMECYLMTILLCRKNGIILSDDFTQTISKSAEFLLYLKKPNGKIPMLGDSAFRFFCPTGDASYDPGQLISIVGKIVENNEFLGVQSDQPEDIFWLSGQDKSDTIGSESGSRGVRNIKVFPKSGHVIANLCDDKLSQYLYFKCGPQGLGHSAGHGHDDVLNFEYSAFGNDFLVDTGTYTYSGTNLLRRYFMSSRAHNLVIVNGQGAAQPSDGAFGWKRTVNGELLEVAASEDVVWIRGQHHGYKVKQGTLVIERALLLVRDGYFLVVDRVLGKGNYQIENLLHFHPDIELLCDSDIVEARGKNGKLFVLSLSSEAMSQTLHRGADDVQPGWYSEQYGSLQKS